MVLIEKPNNLGLSRHVMTRGAHVQRAISCHRMTCYSLLGFCSSLRYMTARLRVSLHLEGCYNCRISPSPAGQVLTLAASLRYADAFSYFENKPE